MASRMLPTESATTGQTTGSWRRHRYPAGIGGSGLLALGAAAGTADGSWPCAAPGKFVSPFRSRYKRRHALDMWQEAGTCPPPCRHQRCRWDVSTRGHLPIPQRSGRRASQGVFLATHTALRVALEPLSEWQPITELPPPCTRLLHGGWTAFKGVLPALLSYSSSTNCVPDCSGKPQSPLCPTCGIPPAPTQPPPGPSLTSCRHASLHCSTAGSSAPAGCAERCKVRWGAGPPPLGSVLSRALQATVHARAYCQQPRNPPTARWPGRDGSRLPHALPRPAGSWTAERA